MLTLVFIASLAQPQPGQKLLRADLVRSPKGSNLVLEFAKPIKRTSVPIVPAGRRLGAPPAWSREHAARRTASRMGAVSSVTRATARDAAAQSARKTLRRPSDRSG